MLEYYSDKEEIYTMITFLLGKDSPCYFDSLGKNNENWGFIRQTPTNVEPIIELIFYLFKKSKTKKETELVEEEKIINYDEEDEQSGLKHTDSETQTVTNVKF